MNAVYALRWKGQDLGGLSVRQIRQQVADGRLNLMSQIHTVQGWLILDEFLRRLDKAEQDRPKQGESRNGTQRSPIVGGVTSWADDSTPESIEFEPARIEQADCPAPLKPDKSPPVEAGPPPIYIAKNGVQSGPFAEEHVRVMLSGGLLSSEDPAWRQGSRDWQPLRTILSPSQPPPTPGVCRGPSNAVTIADSGPSAGAQTPTSFPTSHVLHEGFPRFASHEPVGPKGVNGWLAFFCVCLTILAPLMNFGSLSAEWVRAEKNFAMMPALKDAVTFEIIGSAALTVYGFIVGCIVWSGNISGLRIAKTFLLIRLFGGTGFYAIILIMISSLVTSEMVATVLGGEFINSLVFFLIWWFYFKKSIRVRNTYGH